MNDITIVTGLWNIGREELGSFKRNFDHYLDCFSKLLNLNFNFYVYIPVELIDFVTEKRISNNTYIHIKSLQDLKSQFEYFDQVQKIRTDPSWYNSTGWLTESTQAKLEYYNPIVMSKMFLLREAAVNNPFSSKYLFWLDGGIVNSVCPEFIEKLKNIDSYMETTQNRFLMLSFDYDNQYEVHGFESTKFYEYCGQNKTTYVCRGGFFGGTPILIDTVCSLYDQYLKKTLYDGYMGTEENILTILAYKYQNIVHRYCLPDSLVYSFFLSLDEV